MLDIELPSLIIWQFPVRKRGLAPAGVEEADTGFLVGQIGRCGLNDQPVEIELQRFLFAIGLDQLVNCSHSNLVGGHFEFVAVEFDQGKLFGELF